MLRSPRCYRLTAVACGLILLAGCRVAPVIELTTLFEQSEIFVETGTIDLGHSAARRLLIDGWSPVDERWAQREKETFVWARGTQASLRFYQIGSRLQRVKFRGRPNVPDGNPLVSTIHLQLNGVTLPTSIDVVAGWHDYVLPLPSRFLRVGTNQLTFVFDGPLSDEVSPTTSLRFAFDQVQFFDATVTALPRLGQPSGERGLILPYLSGVAFDLDLMPGTVLRIGLIEAYGRPLPEAGTLHIYIDTEGQRDHQVVTSTSNLEIPIAIDTAGRVRLSMLSLPPSSFYSLQGHAAEQDAGLWVRQPTVTRTEA